MGILRPRRTVVMPTREKQIVLTGGLNEAVSNLELKPGELTACQNYVEKDGISHGYSSYPGYERYDGQALSSTISTTAVDLTHDTGGTAFTVGDTVTGGTSGAVGIATTVSGTITKVTVTSGVYQVGEVITGGSGNKTISAVGTTYDDDVRQEIQRALIKPIGDTACEEKARGVAYFNDLVYGWRNAAAAGAETLMYVESASSWSAVSEAVVIIHDDAGAAFTVGELVTGGTTGATGTIIDIPSATQLRVEVVSGTFNDAAETITGSGGGGAGAPASTTNTLPVYPHFNRDSAIQTAEARFSDFFSNGKIMVVTDGVSDPHLFYNGYLSKLVPTAGTLPSTYPTLCGIWKNRLFLAYPGGHLLFSGVGDPRLMDPAAANAGEIYVGEDITDIELAPGGKLVITTLNKIRVISYETPASTPAGDFLFEMDEFSETSGAIGGTLKRMLGTMYFCDDRGVTTFEATDQFGDFSANTLAKKVETSYQNLRDDISLSIVDRAKNQYTVWFNSSTTSKAIGLVFTFSGKNLRGAGYANLETTVECSAAGKDANREDIIYFGDGDGYVQRMNSGTSFDGEPIETRGATSFYHYQTPNKWKHYRRLTFEVSAEEATSIDWRIDTNYQSTKVPVPITQTKAIPSASNTYNVGVWGTFVWGSSFLNQVMLRAAGYGVNMRVVFATRSKYRTAHTIHNLVTEYTLGSLKVN